MLFFCSALVISLVLYENLQNYDLEMRSAEEKNYSSIITIHLGVQVSL